MLSIILWSSVIIGGAIAYGALGGEYKQIDRTVINEPREEDIYRETYDYFMTLPLEEQHQYIKDNYDLAYYEDELIYDNKQSTAREVSRRAEKLDKKFTNRNKRY